MPFKNILSKRFILVTISFLITAIISIAGYLYFINEKPVLAQTVYSIPADRVVLWQGNVGVSGDIPNRTVRCATIDAATYGNGTTDATLAINTAISSCPANQVVYLPAGTYLVSNTIALKSDVVVRGAGMGVTTIKGVSGFSGNFVMSIRSGSYSWDLSTPAAVNISGGITKGSMTIITSSAHGWSAGDIILIDQLVDPTGDPPITTAGDSGTCTWCGRLNGTRPIGQLNKIISVTPTTATLEIPLYWNYDLSKAPQGVKINGATNNAGIEDLTVDNSISGRQQIIYIAMASNSWLKSVEGIGSVNQAVRMYGGYRNTIRGSKFHEGVPATPIIGSQYGPSHAYGIWLNPWASANLIEDNQLYHLSIGIFLEGNASGNVLAYNYGTTLYYTDVTWSRSMIGNHGAHPMMNLWEGNWVEDKFTSDWYWGSSSHNTIFRNRLITDISKTYGTWGLDIFKNQHYYNVLGNVLGTPGFENIYELENDTFAYPGAKSIYKLGYINGGDWNPYGNDASVKTTMLRHMNYDYFTNTTKICNDAGEPGCQGGTANQTLPSSLYLSSKPSWWGSQPWPPIGPDVAGYAASIPAKDRFLNVSNPPVTYQCSDGTDNDSDGLTDYPSDPGCSSSTDNDEYNAPVQTFLPEQYIQVEGGQLTSMQTGTSGSDTYIYTTIDNTGSVKFTFDIQTAGQYKLEARVNSNNDGGQNSFFVGLDNEPAQGNILYTYNIFPLIAGFVWDEVSKWGNGQTGNPPISEFDPITYNLSQGTHSFTFYGRESNTWLDQIILKKITADIIPPAAPTGLVVQ
ncbi:MAG: glycosyl hydrolase family 28-related protein [Patescibacteria group bacterium]